MHVWRKRRAVNWRIANVAMHANVNFTLPLEFVPATAAQFFNGIQQAPYVCLGLCRPWAESGRDEFHGHAVCAFFLTLYPIKATVTQFTLPLFNAPIFITGFERSGIVEFCFLIPDPLAVTATNVCADIVGRLEFGTHGQKVCFKVASHCFHSFFSVVVGHSSAPCPSLYHGQ